MIIRNTRFGLLFSVSLTLIASWSVAFQVPAAAKEKSARNLPDPVTDGDFRDNGEPNAAMVSLGRFLFFDKILSGNRNISCATCHHALTDTGDGLSLPIGEGGRGLGVTRDTGIDGDAIHERVPRNAPPVFNLGAAEFETLFHDGRVERLPAPTLEHPTGVRSPAGTALPPGLTNVLAVQAMFPVTSATEMAGQAGENSIADAAAANNLPAVWELIAQRLRETPDYVDLFVQAFDDVDQANQITFVHAANAIAAFEAATWRFDNSPFDRWLRGDKLALSGQQLRGLKLFYGSAGCADCHSGKFQTDQGFHAIAMVQIGPGKGDGIDGREDFGRERVSGDSADRFNFRTPTLRNVELTAPYGHSGAYDTLDAVVRHHLDPAASLESYDQSQAVLPPRPDLDLLDFVVMDDSARLAEIAARNALSPVDLSDQEIEDLIAFLRALTDPAAIDLRQDVPLTLPSGLPVFD